MKIKRWLNISELGGDSWILPIWSAVNQAVDTGKVKPLQREVYDLGLFISIRLNILPRVIKRINSAVDQLYSVAKNCKKHCEYTKDTEGYAIQIDDDLKYNLLCDIDSILFELNSVCELIKKLVYHLHTHTGKPMQKEKVGKHIRSIIENAGKDASWFILLDTHRNFFIHDGAPYLSIDITEAPIRFDLLIWKEHLKNYDNPEKFVRLSEINNILLGFSFSKPLIQKDLINLYI